MKKVVYFLILISALLFTGCQEKVEIPNLVNTELEVAKNVLSANGLIPTVEYQYSDVYEKGKVIDTIPSFGEKIAKNERITLYISRGPSYLTSKNSTISWRNISSKMDSWHFYSPYIENDILKIDCYEVKFGHKMEWVDTYNEGLIIGNASINDTFDKRIPITAKYAKRSFNANEKQGFVLEIPLSDLTVERPTDMYIELFAKVSGQQQSISINFTMTW